MRIVVGFVCALAAAPVFAGAARADDTGAPDPAAVKAYMKSNDIPVGQGPLPGDSVLRPSPLARDRKQPRFGPMKRVEGLGNAQFDAGRHIYRFRLRDGSYLETHGPDPAPVATEPNDPQVLPAVTSSGVNLPTSEAYPPVCTGGSGHRLILVYVNQSGTANNYSTGAAFARTLIRRASTKLTLEAVRSSFFGRSASYKVQCDAGGTPIVLGLSSPTLSFADIASTVLSYYNPTNLDAVRFVVFVDGADPAPFPAAGYGTAFTADDPANYTKATGCPSGGNIMYCRSLVAAVYQPWWGTHALMHEIGHTLGAVQQHWNWYSTGDGHCTDGDDIMCQSGPNNTPAMTDTRCPDATYNNPNMYPFDCGYDEYFSTITHSPAQWTDLFWNVGGKEDDWLAYSPAWP